MSLDGVGMKTLTKNKRATGDLVEPEQTFKGMDARGGNDVHLGGQKLVAARGFGLDRRIGGNRCQKRAEAEEQRKFFHGGSLMGRVRFVKRVFGTLLLPARVDTRYHSPD
jgi:hypothetical protein